MFMVQDEVGQALQRLVESLLEEVGIERPPVEAHQVARRLGLEVRLNCEQRARGRLVNRDGQPTICLRPEPRLERYQWTIAHEIGEHLMPRIAADLAPRVEAGDPAVREQLADRFATLLLVPLHWLEFDGRMSGHDLFALKKLYATASYEVLALRMLDLDPPTVISIFDHGRLTRRRANLGNRPPALLTLEHRAQRHCHEQGEACRLCAHPVTVQAWPVHEPDWKREILRTIVDPDVG